MARLQVCVGAGFTTIVFDLTINVTKPALTITEWLYSFPFPIPYSLFPIPYSLSPIPYSLTNDQ